MRQEIFRGAPFSRGADFGARLRAQGVVTDKSPVFALTDARRAFAAGCLPLYEALFPQVVREIEGMAAGQGIPAERLFTLLFSMYCFDPQQRCTCFAFLQGKTVVFGRNSDFLSALAAQCLRCFYRNEEGYSFVGDTTSFIQMEDGVNETGFAAGLTFVCPAVRKPGLNAGMLLRYLLERCESTPQAIDALRRLPRAGAQTLTLADRRGEIAVVECDPDRFSVRRPGKAAGFVAATNHFRSAALQGRNPPPGFDDWRSRERYEAVESALRSRDRRGDPVLFAQKLLSGQWGFVCQQGGEAGGADTLWSTVCALDADGAPRVYLAQGNPSRTRFEADSLALSILGGR